MAHNAINKIKYNKKRYNSNNTHNITTISSPKQKLHRKSPITKSAHAFDYVSYRNAPNVLRTWVSIHWYEST